MHNIIIGSSDNAFSLVVDGSDTFDTIKAKILEKEKTLTCHTNQQPPPQLPKQYKIPITVSTISQNFDLEVESSDTLDTILSMIRDKEVIRTRQRSVSFPKLHPPPPPLPPKHGDDHGHYYFMDWKSVPAPATELIQIFVKVYGGEKTTPLKVKRSDTIVDVKDCIYKTEGIKPLMQKLYFAGMLLKDGVALTDYNIHGEVTLDLLFEVSGLMIIYFETIKGKVSLRVTPDHKIGEVESSLRKKARLSLDQPLTLVYAGRQLNDFFTLSDYDIQTKAVLRVVDDDDKDPMMRIQIHVNIVTSGKTISLQVRRSDTIHHVKTMIQDMEDGILARKQILFLPQKRLEDELTLADYHIRDQSTLHLLVYTPEMEHYEDGFADYSV